MTRDPRIDAYIEEAAPFARPILRRLREIVHAACPEVVETIKWRAPYFEHHGPLCGIMAFQRHCAIAFWNNPLAAGEPLSMPTMAGPADWPKIVTLFGSPPNAAMLACTHRSAAMVSINAWLPDAFLPDSFVCAPLFRT